MAEPEGYRCCPDRGHFKPVAVCERCPKRAECKAWKKAEEAAKALGLDLSGIDHEPGVAP